MLKYNSDSLRSEKGEGYYTIIDDNIVIPWKPLSIGDFFRYEDLAGTVAPSVLQDEIFCKCVTDKELVKDLNFLPAGTVDIVVQNILSCSGPGSIDEFNSFLDQNRQLAQIPIHFLIPLVLRAFPSYKLEEIYAMPYELFMLRLAQAEFLLMRMGVITEPVMLTDAANKPKKKGLSPEDMKRVKEKWESQNKLESPIFEGSKLKVRKGMDDERLRDEQAVGTEEDNQLRAQMVKEAAMIYSKPLAKLKDIKSK